MAGIRGLLRGCGVHVRERERDPDPGHDDFGEEAQEEEEGTDDECLEGGYGFLVTSMWFPCR